MRDVVPLNTEPNDGASVLVVEGLGAGLGSRCSTPSLDNTNFITISAVEELRPVITEITPQSVCSCNTQDWKNVALQVVADVHNSAPTQAAAWWGGLMLDEEDGFWNPTRDGCPAGTPDSVAAFEDINASVAALMNGSLVDGGSWWYTENFASLGSWSQSQFETIGGNSFPAPQIANDNMVSIANLYHSHTGKAILVTWSLNSDYQFDSLYGAEFRIVGPPFGEWGLNLSNCFTTGAEACNDWDGDGITNSADNCISVANQNQANTDANNGAFGLPGADSDGDACDNDDDGDGCADTVEQGPNHVLGGERNPLDPWDFFDADGNRSVDLNDTVVVLGAFGETHAQAPALDRAAPDPNRPWHSEQAFDGVDVTDATTSLGQFGNGCG